MPFPLGILHPTFDCRSLKLSQYACISSRQSWGEVHLVLLIIRSSSLKFQLTGFFLESMLFGVFSVLYAIAGWELLSNPSRKRDRARTRRRLFWTATVMYVLAVAVCVVVSLRWSCRNSQYFCVASCSRYVYVAAGFYRWGQPDFGRSSGLLRQHWEPVQYCQRCNIYYTDFSGRFIHCKFQPFVLNRIIPLRLFPADIPTTHRLESQLADCCLACASSFCYS